jgi:hypothetical protein
MKILFAALITVAAAPERGDVHEWLNPLPRDFVENGLCWHALQAPMLAVPVPTQRVDEAVQELHNVSVRALSREEAARFGGPPGCTTDPCYLVRAVEYPQAEGTLEASYCITSPASVLITYYTTQRHGTLRRRPVVVQWEMAEAPSRVYHSIIYTGKVRGRK